MTSRPRNASLVAALALLAFSAGCAAKGFRVGDTPFPAAKPVLLDEDGREVRGLPAFPEKLTLAVFDFPWCPPCRDAWDAIRAAGVEVPEGSVHVARILFERETLISQGGKALVPPMGEPRQPDIGRIPLATLRAIPRAFRDAFELEQAPLLLLIDDDGRVVRRWTGASADMSEEIAEEIKRRWSAPLPPGT